MRTADGGGESNDDALERRLAWIFGSPRTGSTWLLRMLIHPWRLARNETGMQAPNGVSGSFGPPVVVGINEPHLPIHLTPFAPPHDFSTGSHPPETLLRNTERATDAGYFFNEIYADSWRPAVRRLVLERFRAQVLRATDGREGGGSIVAVKEPNGSHGAGFVMSLLPQARLIFLIRDGRDVVDSLLALRLPGGVHAPATRTLTSDGTRRGAPPIRGRKARLSYLEEAARLWVTRMNAVQEAYDGHPAELRFRLHYEDLRRDAYGQLRPLLRWLGHPGTDDDVRRAADECAFEALPAARKGLGTGRRAAQPGLWQANLSRRERRAVEGIMGDKLAELGYPV